MSAATDRKWVVLGQVGKVHGIKGWLRLNSFTVPAENILEYSRFTTDFEEGGLVLEIDQYKQQAKGLIVHFKGYDDPENAKRLIGSELKIEANELPNLEVGDYYWHELEGLEVCNTEGQILGIVDRLLETGANDVLVVKPNQNSIDDRERLVPYIKEAVITAVDIQERIILVNWEADYLE